MTQKAALIILDGWGHGKNPKVSAIAQANIPFVNRLYNTYPNAELVTYGEEVGLPEGQMGNSEVGHLNIGAGRIVYQELARIHKAVKENTLATTQGIQNAIEYTKSHECKVHLMGLISDGGVHSHVDHLLALCKIFEVTGKNIYIHGFTDGRDVDPRSGISFIKKIQDHTEGTSARLATLIGRYYAMDRDNRWERVQQAYDLLVHGQGRTTDNLIATVKSMYEESVTDEFLTPVIQASLKDVARIEEGDVVLFFNFRTDRPRQLTQVLTQKPIDGFDMMPLKLQFYTMTEYDESYTDITPIFTKDALNDTLGETISKQGLKQLRAAETEKYPHVTFFLNGGLEQNFTGEDRILVDSPKVATYDLMPQMSAVPLTKEVIKFVKRFKPDLLVLNYANTDMVGHTGIMRAAKLAAQTVDRCLEKLIPELVTRDYHIVIIADHGNADIMINPDGSPNTAHTTNPVPIIVISPEVANVRDGKLADVAPTLLKLMNIPQPEAMTGKPLIS